MSWENEWDNVPYDLCSDKEKARRDAESRRIASLPPIEQLQEKIKELESRVQKLESKV